MQLQTKFIAPNTSVAPFDNWKAIASCMTSVQNLCVQSCKLGIATKVGKHLVNVRLLECFHCEFVYAALRLVILMAARRGHGVTSSAYHFLIIGCGLGGLAAAIGIKRAGHDVTISEKTAELQEVRCPIVEM
jgi:NADPH-dependent glutamate synthase beta subunit-like oxidoreductase